MVLLYRLEGSFAVFSLSGSLLIIITFLFIKELRKHPTGSIFFLSVCDFFFSLKFLLSSIYNGNGGSSSLQDNEAACIAQSVFAQFFVTASISWIAMITLNLFLNLRNPLLQTDKYLVFYHMWVWGYSFVITVEMLLNDQYGKSGDGTCWIKENENKDATNWFQLTFFIPLLIYWILAIIVLIYASIRLRHQFPNRRTQEKVMKRMIFFVIVFIVFWIGPIVRRVDQYFQEGDNIPIALQYWDGIAVSLQGFANAFVWLTHPPVFRGLYNGIIRKCCCMRKAENLPLLHAVTEHFQDSEKDIQTVDRILRREIILSLLNGIRQSVQPLPEISAEPSTTRNSNESSVSIQFLKSNQRLGHQEILSPDGTNGIKYTFMDYAPLIFNELRKQDGISKEDYLSSFDPEKFLNQLENQKWSEGKSGSFFCFSPDKRFIMKTIDESEACLLENMIVPYYKHINSNSRSFITRLYGFHVLKVEHYLTVYTITMSNLFDTELKIHEKYDLKGSWENRFVKEHELDTSVLGKDGNLKRKLYLTTEQKTSLISQLSLDAEFLCSMGVMDYSLLLGFHLRDYSDQKNLHLKPKQGKEEDSSLKSKNSRTFVSVNGKEIYFIGIIDILQGYNFHKRLERAFKIYGLRKAKDGLSVQPVDIYCKRFIRAIANIIDDSSDHK